MHPSHFAATTPDKPALIMAETGETISFRQLEARANQAAHWFRSLGLRRGDHVAFMLENQPTVFIMAWAAQRSGLYCTPISSRLTAGESDYIVRDCDAKVFVTSTALADTAVDLATRMPPDVHRALTGGSVDGYESFDARIAEFPETPIDDPSSGGIFFYSSGTTGRPKGIARALPEGPFDGPMFSDDIYRRLYGFNSDVVYLSPAPLYHGAPLHYSMAAMHFGGTVVVMTRFVADFALQLIERHRVTHSQWVPTMFVRMLKLPEEARRAFDLSSQRVAIHAAAPCPIEIKRRMIDWWGPVVCEYYGGSEANGLTFVGAEDWLSRPGTVGSAVDCEIHIVDEAGAELPPRHEGGIYFSGGGQFSYYKDVEKTRGAHHEKGWSTLGDIGYLDDDGFLFLTDRKAHMIISGGVNIYPQEAESLLVTHPKVFDVAVIGVPNPDFGEEVKAVVQPVDFAAAGPDLAAELIAFSRANLSDLKCPRTVDFVAELPRLPTGKVQKRVIRAPYWAGHASRII